MPVSTTLAARRKKSPFLGAIAWLYAGTLLGVIPLAVIVLIVPLITNVVKQHDSLRVVYLVAVVALIIAGIFLAWAIPVGLVTRYMWRRNNKPVGLNRVFFRDAAKFLTFLLVSHGGLVVVGLVLVLLLGGVGMSEKDAEALGGLVGVPLWIVSLYLLSEHLERWEQRLEGQGVLRSSTV